MAFNRIKIIHNLLKSTKLTKKVKLYFHTLTAGEDFDPEERNYTETHLNPIAIRGIVTQVSPEALVWKQYGLAETGAVEIITDSVHLNKFKICSKVVVDSDEYQVFKEGTGGKALIQERSGNLIRVILQRK